MNKEQEALALREMHAYTFEGMPTEPRRCLNCDHWMRSIGPDHRICNICKDPINPRRGQSGSRIL